MLPDGQSLCWSDGKAIVRQPLEKGAETWRVDRGASLLASDREGKLLAAFDNNSIALIDAATGQVLREIAILGGHASKGLMISPDGKRLASIGPTILIWEIETGVLISRTSLPVGNIVTIALRSDFSEVAFTSGQYGKPSVIYVCETRAGTLAPENARIALAGHDREVFDIDFSPNGRRLASGGAGGTIKIWDTETGVEMANLVRHAEWVRQLKFSPDGSRLLSRDNAGRVIVWNAAWPYGGTAPIKGGAPSTLPPGDPSKTQ
jgi:WD40 repeat protein